MERELLENRKKTIYELMCSDIYVPMKLKELAVFLDVPREERPALEEVLNQLLAEGRIELSKRGKYSKAEGKYITGVFVGNARGFGFVTVEGEAEDIFISESAVNGAMHGDRVQVSLLPGHNRTYARCSRCHHRMPSLPSARKSSRYTPHPAQVLLSSHKLLIPLPVSPALPGELPHRAAPPLCRHIFRYSSPIPPRRSVPLPQ